MPIGDNDNKSDILKIDQIYSLDLDDHSFYAKIPKRWKRIMKNGINDVRKKDSKVKSSIGYQLCLKKYYKYLIR